MRSSADGPECPEDSRELWRLFIALPVAGPQAARLAEAQRMLRKSGVRIAWVRPEHMHLTLVFLGGTPASRVPELAAVLDRAAAVSRPFALELSCVGAFGSARAVRVLWAGPAETPPGLGMLHRGLCQSLAEMGIVVDTRPLAAHVTLGRVRAQRGAELLLAALERINRRPLDVIQPVDRLELIRSVPGPQGAAYETLHEARWGAEG